MSVDPAHDRAFFEQMLGQREPYRRLAEAIDEVFGAGDAVDLGCGVGCCTARLAELGWSILGVDGAEAAEAMRERGFSFTRRDLTTPGMLVGRAGMDRFAAGDKAPFLAYPARVVLCTETAEHLPASAADVLVSYCVQLASDWIVWSAAPPGARWPGHLNCQPPAYWLDRFAAQGWTASPTLTEKLRTQMRARKAQHDGGAESFFVLWPA